MALFGWIIRRVVQGVLPPSPIPSLQKAHQNQTLGLLDIYGFEVLSENGFEQLLINYCNERLQQISNRQVFALEAAEYISEGLDDSKEWGMLADACQLPALTLLEGSPGGSIGIFG